MITEDQMPPVPRPGPPPMVRKIRGIAIYADKEFIRGRLSGDKPGMAPAPKGAGYGKEVVLLRQG